MFQKDVVDTFSMKPIKNCWILFEDEILSVLGIQKVWVFNCVLFKCNVNHVTKYGMLSLTIFLTYVPKRNIQS